MMHGELEQKVRKFFSKAIDLLLGEEENALLQMVRKEERRIVELISYSARRVNSEEHGTYGDGVKVKKPKPYRGSTADTKVQVSVPSFGLMEYHLSFLCSGKKANIVVGIQGYQYGLQKNIFDLVEEGLIRLGYKKERISGDFIRYEKTLVT